MPRTNTRISPRALLRLLAACIARNASANANAIPMCAQIHPLVLKSGHASDAHVGGALVDAYSKCGFVAHARNMFDEMQVRDLVLWNVMLSCYSLHGLGEESWNVFKLMRDCGFVGDGFTFSGLLRSCSSLRRGELGRLAHGLVVRLGLGADVVVGGALVDMYAKCGDVVDSRRAFDGMVVRNVVSWNAMIVGYGKHGSGKEAMELLIWMLRDGYTPDELTLASVLSSCAHMAAANEATQVHGYVVKNGLQEFVQVGNALVMAYAKNGFVQDAYRSFCLISKPDLVTWSSMVSSYAYLGLPGKAIDVFERLLQEGIRPDGVAFLGVLSACSHAGLVEAGLSYFVLMRRDYQIGPNPEHFACLVDLLGRAGRLEDAYNVLVNICVEPNADVLGAFLSACKMRGNTILVKWAANRLLSLEPNEPVNYLLMSNSYAAVGSWSDVAKVRSMMRNKCGDKVPGCSWTEIGGTVHTFVSNDMLHHRSTEMQGMLELLVASVEKEYIVDAIVMDDDLTSV